MCIFYIYLDKFRVIEVNKIYITADFGCRNFVTADFGRP